MTEADLAWMRSSQADLLPERVVIDDHTPSADGRGGQVDAWTEREADPLPARVAPPTGRTAEVVAARYGPAGTHVVTLPAGTEVGLRARLNVTTAEGVIRGTYEVLGHLSGGSWETATRLVAKAVE